MTEVWVVLVSFVGGEASWHGPFRTRGQAAKALCLLGHACSVCRHECEFCGRDHSTGQEDYYGKLATRRSAEDGSQ